MATGRSGKSIKTKLGFLIFGEQGTRKSSFCLEMLKLKTEEKKDFRVLYIDSEAGSVDDLLNAGVIQDFNPANIFIIYTQSMSEAQEFIRRAKDDEDFYEFDENGNETDVVILDGDGTPFRPDAIVVDSLTVFYSAKQQSYQEFSKKRATVRAKKNELTGMERDVTIEGAGLEIKDFNSLKFAGQNFILDLLSCGKHFAVTMREVDEQKSIKDDKNEYKRVPTGNKIPDGFKDVMYNVKTVLRMFKDDDGVLKCFVKSKDRTLVHQQDDIIDEISVLDWQRAIDRGVSKKDFTVPNGMRQSIQDEVKAMELENNKILENEASDASEVSDAMTVSDYHGAINKLLSAMTPIEKSKKVSKVIESGLSRTYSKITDIASLSKFLSILKDE